jgi:ATP-binding cassette subfamily B protein
MAGKIMAFLLYLNLLFRPLRVIADKFNVLQMGMIASERVFKVLDNEDYIQPSEKETYEPSTVRGKIEFDHVSFSYTGSEYVLKDISFIAQPGETIALVGHTGSGKTSIISLLNRLYHIQTGTIKIDDVPIDEYKLDSLRKNFGVVLQDVFLFSGSVMDNITLRNPEISIEQVEHAARMIDVHEFIMQLPAAIIIM